MLMALPTCPVPGPRLVSTPISSSITPGQRRALGRRRRPQATDTSSMASSRCTQATRRPTPSNSHRPPWLTPMRRCTEELGAEDMPASNTTLPLQNPTAIQVMVPHIQVHHPTCRYGVPAGNFVVQCAGLFNGAAACFTNLCWKTHPCFLPCMTLSAG
jgi:hypothetical protein